MNLKKIYLLICLAGPLAACSGGTGTGNPYSAGIPASIGELPRSRAVQLAICQLLTRCNSNLLLSTCLTETSSLNGVETRLGIAGGYYLNFEQVISAETEGQIGGNLAASLICINELNSLSCAESAVMNAYQVTNSSPFAGVPALIPPTPGSCSEIF